MWPQATVYVGEKSLSFKTVFLEPAIMTYRKTAPLFTERLLALLTVTTANQDKKGTVIGSAFVTTDCKPNGPLKSVVKLMSNRRSEV